MKPSIKRAVWRRAQGICEYCRMPSELYPSPYQIDHIVAEKHGGRTALANLALACYHCNLHKGPNIAGKDPSSRKTTRLFHPRRDRWNDHFRWHGAKVVGRTAIGRTTVRVLEMNHATYLLVRRSLIDAGLFFPDEE